MNNFVTWEFMTSFVNFIAILWMLVGVLKELPLIRKLPTKYLAIIIGFIMLLVIDIHAGVFQPWNIVLYLINAILVSFTTKGGVDFNNKKGDI